MTFKPSPHVVYILAPGCLTCIDGGREMLINARRLSLNASREGIQLAHLVVNQGNSRWEPLSHLLGESGLKPPEGRPVVFYRGAWLLSMPSIELIEQINRETEGAKDADA